MSRSVKLVAVAVSVVLMVAFMFQPVAAATGTLDQQQTSILGAFILYSSPPESSFEFLGQTFTAGLTGLLTEVDLAVACEGAASCTTHGPVTVEIHSGDPTGALLASASLLGSAIPTVPESAMPSEFVAFVFSSPPAVVAGSVYAIVITTTNAQYDPPRYVVGNCYSGNPYAAGTAYYNDGSWREVLPSGQQDLAFKTYVAPPEVQFSSSCGGGESLGFTATGFPSQPDFIIDPDLPVQCAWVGGVASCGFGVPIPSDVTSITVTAYIVDSEISATAIWTPCPIATGGPVGGFLEPVNNLAIAAPYLALLGVAAAVMVVVWKRRDN